MGLERLTAVVQNVKSNYATDLFEPILKSINKIINVGNQKLNQNETNILADHIRAVVFGIADGVVPSNDGRGYIIKRLIIDATDLVLQADSNKASFYKLVPSVIEVMGETYPEIVTKANDIEGIIKNVEESYIKVRKERVPELVAEIKKIIKSPKKEQSAQLGKIIFTYRDTFGLTIPTILALVDEEGIAGEICKKAESEFNKYMEEQQSKSRASSKISGDVFIANIDADIPKTVFWGQKQAEVHSRILKIYKDAKEVETVNKGDTVKAILDESPFYAEAGGQIGDSGYIVGEKGRIRIEDTQQIAKVYLHSGIVEEGTVKSLENITAKIDGQRRHAIMCHHTATHLLQAALRKILGQHVQQQGSLVAQDRLRFDFTHHKALTKEEINEIVKCVNTYIRNCDPVMKEIMPIKQARDKGALAFFADKYGDTVRVVSIGDYSKEFCGGTHLDSTGEIGLFKITEDCAIAQGIRRLEAKVEKAALDYTIEQEQQLDKVSKILKSPRTEVVNRLNAQTKKLKQMEKDLEKFRFEAVKSSMDSILDGSDIQNGTKIISHLFEDSDMNLLRKISDLIKCKSKSSVIVLGSKSEEQASILLSVSDDLVKKGIKASDLIQDIAPLIGGRGGGRAGLAQAGSKETGKVKKAIEEATRLIKEKIKS